MAHRRPDKAQQYLPPFRKMIERLLAVGRNADGVWFHDLDTVKGVPITPRPVHCWGYLYNAVHATFQLTGERGFRNEVERAMTAVARKPTYLFDDNPPVKTWKADAYSDSVESALVLLKYAPNAELEPGIDMAVAKIRAYIRPSGLVEGWHGDGNTIRTLLMFALWKSQGVRVEPWRPDLKLGAVSDGTRLLITIASDAPWSGSLVFDYPRHRVHWGMRENYPRLNEWPEWYVVEDDSRYFVSKDGTAKTVRIGAELRQGLGLEVTAGKPMIVEVTHGGLPPYGATRSVDRN
jgi:hypothetical protein